MNRSNSARARRHANTGGLLGAALAVVALPHGVQAEAPPEQGALSVRYLYYKDSQPNLDRVKVSSPSVGLLVPFAGAWSFEANGVVDSLSGATPRWHTAVSGASRMEDRRKAGDASVTRYFERGSVTLGGAYSTENDYESRAGSVRARIATPSNNTTLTVGYAATRDEIDDVNGVARAQNAGRVEKKRVDEFLIGVTQVLTPKDVVQATFTFARGRGYYSDPYKFPDNRPRERDQSALQLRWNHFFEDLAATFRAGYRFYNDTFEITAHTVEAEWIQQLGNGWTITPSVRYHGQSSAEFYYDPVYDATRGEPFPPGYQRAGGPVFYSADQRLSAFGAWTGGLKVAKQINRDWLVDAKAEYYEQRGDWRIGHEGSTGLEPFKAQLYQVGVTTRF